MLQLIYIAYTFSIWYGSIRVYPNIPVIFQLIAFAIISKPNRETNAFSRKVSAIDSRIITFSIYI